MEKDVWKRIEFETYKRQTKEDRMNQIKEKMKSTKRISRKE